jgi:hypothetical protein
MKTVLRIVYLLIALGIGFTLGSIRRIGQHITTEYFLELKPNSVVIEGTDGHTIECSYDKIGDVLIKDNL